MWESGSWSRRLLKWAVIIEVMWLVLGNAFIHTPAGPALAGIRPDKFTMSWGGGYSLYPGHAALTDLKMSIHTWSTDVDIAVDHASARLRLLPLFAKRLVIAGVEGGMLAIDVRFERPEGEKPKPRKPYPGLTIAIPGASVAGIRRFSFNEMLMTGGTAQAEATLSFQIRGEQNVEWVDATWQDAALSIDGQAFSSRINAGFQGGLTPFNPKVDRGVAVIRKIFGHVTLTGQVDTLSALGVLWGGAPWIERLDGSGRVDLDAQVEDGSLRAPSRIAVAADQLELDFLGFRAQGVGHVLAKVEAIDDPQPARAEVRFDEFELLRRGDELPLAEGEGLTLVARAPELGVKPDLQAVDLELDIPKSGMPHAGVLEQFFPGHLDVNFDEGAATLNGWLKVSGADGNAEGELMAEGTGIRGSYDDSTFGGDFTLDAKLDGERIDDFQFGLSEASFRLFNARFDSSKVDVAEDWWMQIDVPRGSLLLSEPAVIEADLDLAMRDTRLLIALFADVREWIKIFRGILTIHDVTGHAALRLSRGAYCLSDLRVVGDELEILGEVSTEGSRDGALVWGKMGFVAGGFERRGTESSWKMLDSRDWFSEHKANNWSSCHTAAFEALPAQSP